MDKLDFIKDNYLPLSLATIAGYVLVKLTSSIAGFIKKRSAHSNQLKNGKFAKDIRDKKIAYFYEKHKDEISKEEIIEITSLSVSELSQKIKTKKITARKALLCYALNAATVGKDLECIADCNFEAALQEANEADKLIESTKNVDELPPLIGLPMTIKDHVPVKDYIDSMGFCSFYDNVAKEDCSIVARLRKLGIVVIGKSNVCQALLSAESTNNIWGHCKNIWDNTRTTGGSSGGEGGLVSSFCSPIGIGTDIGGSIRIPSNFCGIYGFKPTGYKISSKGQLNPGLKTHGAWDCWPCSTGFLARKYEDIILFSRLLFGTFKDEYLVDSRPFNEEVFNSKKKLKIGYFYKYNEYETQCDIAKGIETIVEKLKEKTSQGEYNYELVEFDLSIFDELFNQGYSMIVNGGGTKQLNDCLKGEYNEYYYNDYQELLKSSNLKISFIKFILKRFTKEERVVRVLNKLKIIRTLDQYWEEGDEFYYLRDQFYDYIKKEGIDGFILPVYPFAAPKRGNAVMTNSTFFYNFMISMNDLPAVALPIGNIENTNYVTKYEDQLSKVMKSDIGESKNMPIGIQVASLPGNDEICLRIARDIVKVHSVNYNDLKNSNIQTENFWKLRYSQK